MDQKSTQIRNEEAQKLAESHNTQINFAIRSLCSQWELGLQVPNPKDTPNRRRERGLDLGEKCVRQMVRLQFKGRLIAAMSNFEKEAQIEWKRWVNKPRADGTLLPIRHERSQPHSISDDEKQILLRLLSEILEEECQQYPPTPARERHIEIDDTVIESRLPKSSQSSRKRPSTEFADVQSSKKQRQPQVSTDALGQAHTNATMAPPRSQSRQRPRDVNPNTSFTSTTSSIFSAPSFNKFDSNTQTTIPDDEFEAATQPNTRPSSPTVDHPQSSGYGGSSFEQFYNESFGKDGLPDEESPFLIDHDQNSAIETLCQDPANKSIFDLLHNLFRKFIGTRLYYCFK